VKTIYLLHTRHTVLQPVMIAFECRECADIQASWFKRDHVPVTVTAIYCYAHVRDAQQAGCDHLRIARPGKNARHEHVPMMMEGTRR